MKHDGTFGTDPEALEAARKAHEPAGRQGVERIGCLLPTREMVRTMPASDLAVMLDLWMYESPTELIPGVEQIEAVKRVLEARPDTTDPGVRDVIDHCEEFLTGS